MPWQHKHCGGEIKWYPPWPIPPRCKKCGKRWNPLVLYSPNPRPKGMRYLVPVKVVSKVPRLQGGKGRTSYAKWAEHIPLAALLASKLPNWPRWVRILVAATFVGGMVYLIWWIF